MNGYRNWDTGRLDRQYLRTCACHKLLMSKKITKDRAIELMKEMNVGGAARTVELWLRDYRNS